MPGSTLTRGDAAASVPSLKADISDVGGLLAWAGLTGGLRGGGYRRSRTQAGSSAPDV